MASEPVGLSAVVDEEAARLRPAPAAPAIEGALAAPKPSGRDGPVGLALSGGGIRSATFSLGVLQALAQKGRLASFDYLSTVSGGGYIGSWLSAWIKRVGLHEVQRSLGRQPAAAGPVPATCEPAEVTWLRRYSNYLAPRVGTFSTDSLTLVATWLRNVGLNLIVLLSCLAAVFIAPLLLLDPLAAVASAYSRAFGFGAAWLGLVFLLGIAFNLWHQGLPINRRRNWLVSAPGVMTTVVIPGLLAAAAGAVWVFQPQLQVEGRTFGVVYVAILLLLLLFVWFIAEGVKRRFPTTLIREAVIHALGGVIALATGTAVLTAIHSLWLAMTEGSSETLRLALMIALGPPALLFAFGIASSVSTGIVGRVYFERSREWWSRLNARFLALGGTWLALGLLSFFALPTLKWLIAAVGAWISLLGTGWIGSLLVAVFGHVPEKASKKTQYRIDKLLSLAASVFVAGLLFLIAVGTSAALQSIGGVGDAAVLSIAPPKVQFDFNAAGDSVTYDVKLDRRKAAPFTSFIGTHMAAMHELQRAVGVGNIGLLPSAFLGVVLCALLFGWRVDVNKFSLHNMYKNRLVRCYLGASNQASRNEQPFIGMDDADDLELSLLAGSKPGDAVQRPLHIYNTALNIAQGSNLAWQERKAASFVLTPLYCGFSLAPTQGDKQVDRSGQQENPGYRPTAQYAARDGEEPGFTLGMALATSGAAVSPNMGRATRPALAFLLTLFNGRLGRWSPNPAGPKWRQPSPRFGLLCLLQELLGLSNEERSYVYLSDGGHFDNTGLYELVRRGCALIFAVDAGADPERQFSDLAEAIRKCRVDLGVEITIDEIELLRGDKSMLADRGFAEATIDYRDGSPPGRLVIMKPTLSRARNEPVDVLNYAARNPPFPQQTTADQFFDESQFESYRCLGEYIGGGCLEKFGMLLPIVAVQPITAPAVKMTEAPTYATRLVALLFARNRLRTVLPGRAGSLVDFFVVAALLCIAFLAGFALFDRVYLPAPGAGVCLSLASCEEQARTLLVAAGTEVPVWANPLFWRGLADNIFVVVYVGMFVMGYIVALGQMFITRTKKYWAALSALCGLALLTAAADYVENFLLLAWSAGSTAPLDAPAQIAPITLTKFALAGLSLLALLVLLRKILAAFRTRWRSSPPEENGRAATPPG